MRTDVSRWVVPLVGLAIGLLIVLAEMGNHASPGQYALAFVVVAGYAVAIRLLQSRSDMASLLSGMPRDERWEMINHRALSLAAQVIAVALLGAFLVTQFRGIDSTPYVWTGAVFGVAYLGGIVWYQVRA